MLLDSELRFREQGMQMIKTGQTWVMQFQRISRGMDGVTGKTIGDLYRAIAIPRMLYGADVTLIPPQKKAGSKGEPGGRVIKGLISIQ